MLYRDMCVYGGAWGMWGGFWGAVAVCGGVGYIGGCIYGWLWGQGVGVAGPSAHEGGSQVLHYPPDSFMKNNHIPSQLWSFWAIQPKLF